MASASTMFVILPLFLVLLSGSSSAQLTAGFYSKSCPSVFKTIQAQVRSAVAKEARMGASVLRLFFHDCFVNGCDASVLLDDTSNFIGEKNAAPNKNSARGFEVIDAIKAAVEQACPGVVSCADVLAIAARDSVVALGGPTWDVKLGRRDARTASQAAANSSIPTPNFNLTRLISSFQAQGLSVKELVALSGSGDNNLAPLDLKTPISFDNHYYKNLIKQKGLLHSDQQLSSGGSTDAQVRVYSQDESTFKADFVAAMIKMGDIKPLTGSNGEIRKNCRKIN